MNALVPQIPLLLGLAIPAIVVSGWLGDAEESLRATEPGPKKVAVAAMAEEGYCTPELKQIVRRVAGACGLLDAQGRGCQPADAAKIVQLDAGDFNRLFLPLKARVHIIQFDTRSAELDEAAQRAVNAAWSDRGGASFFFVVARASPDGSKAFNQKLSNSRAQSVLDFLEGQFKDPDIKKRVGLLWLGEEFAQLTADFCGWTRSRAGTECDETQINRSAFIAWIDCNI
ncbi:MAG: hypothetical protein CVU56_06330 [Deltaproteobacteria bacterium HGW-Deltaproteobacteria-14]|jgi:hypothetical protein|nr:MAG: hypothetical protein CVU56_06330 [Deltaproteobacteria bacterium HGW-Deltaproteobacteria-14]